MNANRNERAIEAALGDFAMEFDYAPDHAALRDWLDRHPALRDDPESRAAVINFAARWEIDAALAPDPSILPPNPERVARGKAIVARVIADLAAARPITSLLAQAQAVRLDVPDVAARTGLSVPLFAQLDRRLIRFDSLPERLFARLADAIGRSVEDVRAYLAGPSALPQGAQFRADHAPVTAGATQDFFAAVREDPLLSPAEKAEWLALAAPDREHS